MAAPEPEDQFGRSTPRSCVAAFFKAFHRENYERAAQYLDSSLELPEREELAYNLGVILDRKLSASLSALSEKPEGNPDDGLAAYRDLLGIIPSESGNVDILLDRVQRGKERPLWLFSAESLQEVPRLYSEVEATWFERYVPEGLRTRRWFSIPLYQWIAVPLSLLLILGIASILTRILIACLRRLLRHLHQDQDDRRLASIAWPLRLQVLALLVYVNSRYSVALLTRRFWGGVAITLTVIAVTWLLMRLGDAMTDADGT